jgi:hypothetical protein
MLSHRPLAIHMTRPHMDLKLTGVFVDVGRTDYPVFTHGG